MAARGYIMCTAVQLQGTRPVHRLQEEGDAGAEGGAPPEGRPAGHHSEGDRREDHLDPDDSR